MQPHSNLAALAFFLFTQKSRFYSSPHFVPTRRLNATLWPYSLSVSTSATHRNQLKISSTINLRPAKKCRFAKRTTPQPLHVQWTVRLFLEGLFTRLFPREALAVSSRFSLSAPKSPTSKIRALSPLLLRGVFFFGWFFAYSCINCMIECFSPWFSTYQIHIPLYNSL